ncbi:MAG: hypothetical protein ACO3OV_02260, partial [Steroidobacteraceae bacterium]
MPTDALEPPLTDELAAPASIVRQPILLIDADPSSLEYMERALSQTGLSVVATVTLSGPDGALALLAARQDIHVIVLDPAALRSG